MLHAVTLLLLQTSSPSVVELILQTVLALVIPMGATWIATQATKLWPAVDGWKDWEKRLLATVYAVIVAGISHALNLNLPEAWGALGTPEFQAILAAAGAMLIHRIFHPQPTVPATARR